jgi:hypothetical protein
MGMEVLEGGIRLGELPLDTTDIVNNPYYGGQPAAIETTGLVRLAKNTDDQAFVGMFAVSSYEDSQNGNATIIIPPAYVRFINGSVSQDTQPSTAPTTTVEGAPYDTTISFQPSNLLYIGTAGLWVNNGTAGQEKGIVTKGNTSADDAVEAIMWGTNLRATA